MIPAPVHNFLTDCVRECGHDGLPFTDEDVMAIGYILESEGTAEPADKVYAIAEMLYERTKQTSRLPVVLSFEDRKVLEAMVRRVQ